MPIRTLSMRELERRTHDIYESVVIIAKRAKQINQNRFMDEAFKDAEKTEMGVFDELPVEPTENYIEQSKATTQAMDEFVDGELKWRRADDIEL